MGTPGDTEEKPTPSVQFLDEANEESSASRRSRELAEDYEVHDGALSSAARNPEAVQIDDDSCSVFTWSKPMPKNLLQDAPFFDRGMPDEANLSHDDLDHTVAVEVSQHEDAAKDLTHDHDRAESNSIE